MSRSEFLQSDTNFHVYPEDTSRVDALFKSILSLLRRNGFTVTKDPRIEKDFKSLSPSHRLARHGDLQCSIEKNRAHVSIEFFQDVVCENKNGGRHDFRKLAKMPYLIRLRFQWIAMKFRRFLDSSEYSERINSIPYTRDPLAAFNCAWDSQYERDRQIHRFDRREDGWPTDNELNCWSRKDANGMVLDQGQSRFCIVNGRAMRCRVYGGINGMWICVYGPGDHDVRSCSAGEIYSIFPGRGRLYRQEIKERKIKAAIERAVKRFDFLRAHSAQLSLIKLSNTTGTQRA